MDSKAITEFVNAHKGQVIEVTLTDATTPQVGEAISVNSKGVNIRVDGKVRAFNIKRVANVATPGVADGMDTAALAALVGTTPKELRVQLRALNMGVGKGRRYTFSSDEVARVRAHWTMLTTEAPANA